MKQLNELINAQGQQIFSYLNNQDVITSKISDHHPIVHDGVFFWNIMMQGKQRGASFNNGFGIMEQSAQYQKRLLAIAHIIAEAVLNDASIEVISLCEGPVTPEDVQVLFQSLMRMPVMNRFSPVIHKPSASSTDWGLAMLVDNRYSVKRVHYAPLANHPKLLNRFQLWKLTGVETRYVALAHFPYSDDAYKTQKETLSMSSQEFSNLIDAFMDAYSSKRMVFCADFNFNPYLISQWKARILDQIAHHNSILLTQAEEEPIKTVTVDGVLLSQKEKQRVQAMRPEPGLIRRLLLEYGLFKSSLKRTFVDLAQKAAPKELCNFSQPAYSF